MPRYCPCGARLERKEYESQAAFEKRLYCNKQHRAKYYNAQARRARLRH